MLGFLFRVHANNNGIYLSVFYGSSNELITIKKSASKKQAITSLKREVEGINWYCRNVKENLITDIINLPNYYSVKLHYIVGEKANYRDGYWVNRNHIKKALIMYCQLWGNLTEDNFIVHGDYSLDNLIYTKDKIVIIDWEHYSETIIPKGFDALNLIYEQIYMFSLIGNIDKKVIDHANLMLSYLYENNCIDEVFWEAPLGTARQYILNNQYIWGRQISKLPIMKINIKQAENLDSLINLKL